MPNYCNNSLAIEGSHITVKKIIDFVRSEESAFDFNKIVPMPDYIYQGALGPEEKKIYGKNNWYDWSIENWGTKWNSDDVEIENNEIQFLTAWSPCDPVIAALAKMYPTMRFTYTFYETEMCFCGMRVYENGKIVFYYDGDYAENPLYEEDDEWANEYVISDLMFPIKSSGFRTLITDKNEIGDFVSGKLCHREYDFDKIHRMTDGVFFAKKDYTFQCDTEQVTSLATVA